MRSFAPVALLAGLAAAAPAPWSDAGPSGHEVTIAGISFAGSGCPAGSVAGQLSSDLTTITLLYDSFVAQAGANTKAADMRKNCQLNVKLQYPSGWQFSVFKADYRGYAALQKGDSGTCKATYYFCTLHPGIFVHTLFAAVQLTAFQLATRSKCRRRSS